MQTKITLSTFFKCICIIISFVIMLPFYIYSQKIRGGLITGFNMTMVDGDQLYGYKKIGLNVGLISVVPLAKNFSLNIETIYNQKGSYQRPRFDDSLNGAYNLKLNYLEVPFYLQYQDNYGGANGGLGLSWGRLVSFSEAEHQKKIPWTKETFPYDKSDWNILADVSFNIKKGWKFNMRYFYSLKYIRIRTFRTGVVRKQYNTGFTFRIIYIIKEPQKDESKK